MPFSPTAPAGKPEPEATGSGGEPDAEAETKTAALVDTWQQEKLVRLTAQRILAERVRDDRVNDQRLTDPPSPRFWPGIRLDLAGATLIDFDIELGVLADADFRWTTFGGVAWFDRATFSGPARFGGATFSGRAWFGEATFRHRARFGGATFSGDAWFAGASFNGEASFSEATFGGAVWFARASFSGADGSLSFEQSRVLSSEARHAWPTGWSLEPDGGGGYTVVRAKV